MWWYHVGATPCTSVKLRISLYSNNRRWRRFSFLVILKDTTLSLYDSDIIWLPGLVQDRGKGWRLWVLGVRMIMAVFFGCFSAGRERRSKTSIPPWLLILLSFLSFSFCWFRSVSMNYFVTYIYVYSCMYIMYTCNVYVHVIQSVFAWVCFSN